MTVSAIQLFGGTPFTTLNNDAGGDGDVYEYNLDFAGGTVSEIVITGQFGSSTTAGDAYFSLFVPPIVGDFDYLGAGEFTYTITLAQAVAYNNAVGDTLVTTVGGQAFGDGSSIIDVDTVLAKITNLCFGAGTMIATPEGSVAVETLEMGDVVRTAEGRDVEVKWIGRQTVSTVFGGSERRTPVRISAGALGENLPHNDLIVTADHAIMVDGVLCHAGALVNGATIQRVPLSQMGGETFVVYHIETQAHELVLAEGVEAETLIDNATRRSFDNYGEYEALFGDAPEMEELPYPRAMSARQVPASIRARLGVAVAA